MTRTRRAAVVLLLALLGLLSVAACGGGDEDAAEPAEEQPGEAERAPRETVTLRVVSFLPENVNLFAETFPLWRQAVEERTDGAVKIEFAGGPESIPEEEQFRAVITGVADVGWNVPNWYINEVPAGQFMLLSPFTPQEERENGVFEYWDRLHTSAGAKYLGRWLSVTPFYFWTIERPQGSDWFSGKRMRSVPTFHHIVQQALQARPITMPGSDVYTGLERGIVDGTGWVLLGARDQGWTDFLKFVLNEPFYNQNGAILINPDKWESLGPELQEQITEATIAFEQEMVETFIRLNDEERQALEEQGIEFVTLSDEESARFHAIWYEETWNAFGEPAPEEQVEEGKQLLRYDELKDDLDQILKIPCAGTGEGKSVKEGCG